MRMLRFLTLLFVISLVAAFGQTINGVTVVTGGIALTGTDINSSNQVTVTHLASGLPINQGGSGQTTQQAAFDALGPTATRAGDVTYWNGTHYVNLAGNNSGTNCLSENSSGVPSWAACSGVSSVSGTSNQIASTGGSTPVLSLATTVLFPGIYKNKVTTVSFTATPTYDLSASNSFEITLTGNVTSSTASNHADGEIVTFHICQDATGGRTHVWPTTVKGAPTIGTTASTCSDAIFYDDGTNLRGLGIGNVNM
jgi:hypothetical protein